MNRDTSYQLLFKLNVRVNDSFYVKNNIDYNYWNIGNDTSDIQFDSFLIKISRIEFINYAGRTRKTWNFSGLREQQFVDSIGYRRSGLIYHRVGHSELFYVCSADSIIHTENKFLLNKNLCSSDSFYKRYGYTISISISHYQRNAIRIYPNPASTSLQIRNPSLSESSRIRILNSLGQEIPVNLISALLNEMSLDVSSLNKGIYTLRIDDHLSGTFIIE